MKYLSDSMSSSMSNVLKQMEIIFIFSVTSWHPWLSTRPNYLYCWHRKYCSLALSSPYCGYVLSAEEVPEADSRSNKQSWPWFITGLPVLTIVLYQENKHKDAVCCVPCCLPREECSDKVVYVIYSGRKKNIQQCLHPVFVTFSKQG